jgi:hypothetical protein
LERDAFLRHTLSMGYLEFFGFLSASAMLNPTMPVTAPQSGQLMHLETEGFFYLLSFIFFQNITWQKKYFLFENILK